MNDQFQQVWDALSYNNELRWFCKRGQWDALGGVAQSPADLSPRRSTNERGYNCYVQLNPAVGFRGLRTSASDITHFRGFLLDLDPDPGASDVTLREMVQTLRVAVRNVGIDLLAAPFLVDSGRGAQAWFVGPPFTPKEPDWRQIARRSVSALVKSLVLPSGVHADPMVCDVSRVVRLPGTKNIRTSRPALIVEKGEPSASLWSALVALDPGEALAGAPELADSHDSYKQVWESLTALSQDFITHGVTYPGRHSALWHTADVLRREGLTREAAGRALWMGASYCNPALVWADVEYALGRTFGQSGRAKEKG